MWYCSTVVLLQISHVAFLTITSNAIVVLGIINGQLRNKYFFTFCLLMSQQWLGDSKPNSGILFVMVNFKCQLKYNLH